MKTTFYDQTGLNGNSAQFDYGSYTTSQITALIDTILSISIPPHIQVTLYGLDNFFGPSYVISNAGRNTLQVTCFSNVFPFTVASVKVDCACRITVNPSVSYNVIKADFVRTANQLYHILITK